MAQTRKVKTRGRQKTERGGRLKSAPRPTPPPPLLDLDLQAPIDAVGATMQERAKMVRRAFSKRDWPNAEHPGTVLDFLVEHDIPYTYGK